MTTDQSNDGAGAEHPTFQLGKRYKISGDQVNKHTADLPDDERGAIRWLHAYATEQDRTLAELAADIRYDTTTVYRVLKGEYEGSLANVAKAILQFKSLYEQRSVGRQIHRIETALVKRIWKVCDAALQYQRIAIIVGETQVGKTLALLWYRDTHNHGSTIYISVPTGGTLGAFLVSFAKALRINPQAREKELRRRIMEAVDDRMLVIVDEVHRVIRASGNNTRSLETIEFLRELFDETHCGMVLCATNVFRQAMDENSGMSEILKQTKRRRLCTLQLPDRPTKEDLDTFAAAYGLPPAKDEALDLQTEVIRDEALGMWLTLLRMAAKVATQREKKMTWDHVISAHAGLRHLEGR